MHRQDTSTLIDYVREFLRLESAAGILLFAAAVLALLIENSPLDHVYDLLLSIPVEIRVGNLEVAKPLLLWINDGLMAIFFFLVGLEIKREVLEGELSAPESVLLPAIGALGGMLVPAVIYASLNWGNAMAMQGWAIPSATDIAFALGVVALMGERVPNSLKLFLLTLAIVDDIGAIIIIALFYSGELSASSLYVSFACMLVLWMLNRRGVVDTAPYIIVGIVFWVAVLKSGVHATLAGLILAFFIPLTSDSEYSPLKHLEEDLHPVVAFAILPIFAFANVGIPLDGLTFASLLEPVPLGIALGLFLGNQIGVFGLSFLAIRLGFCRLPENVSWLSLYGVACLCGIGFTMSLFISSLAFEVVGTEQALNDRLGILLGSLISAVWGLTVLYFALPRCTSSD